MKTYFLKNIPASKYENLLKRPAIDTAASYETVKPVLKAVKEKGIDGALKYARIFDGFYGSDICVDRSEIKNAAKNIPVSLKKAIGQAYKNIFSFHSLQKPGRYKIETMPGIWCQRDYRPIENVGLYIPGGNAVLFSTLLMLAIPAKIAGCKRIAVFSPGKENGIADELLYTASICGIDEFYKIGGAQAVALMAYGCKSIPKVDKIFGPGNQYVTAAKALVSIDSDGCAIDIPAGPSEVMVIADKFANPKFIAADLLSQAEHGNDSQAILLTDSESLAARVKIELESQARYLKRNKEIAGSLNSSFIMITNSLEEAFHFSNKYAPEHLVLNIKNAGLYSSKIINAGSVFLGENSPECVGDYASGTNHSLPTYGYAKSYSGITVEQFMKSITFQKINKKGLKNISGCVITLANAEQLQAHANAVSVRLKK